MPCLSQAFDFNFIYNIHSLHLHHYNHMIQFVVSCAKSDFCCRSIKPSESFLQILVAFLLLLVNVQASLLLLMSCKSLFVFVNITLFLISQKGKVSSICGFYPSFNFFTYLLLFTCYCFQILEDFDNSNAMSAYFKILSLFSLSFFCIKTFSLPVLMTNPISLCLQKNVCYRL